jgi:nucleoside-diphosphate-sugar epimerase
VTGGAGFLGSFLSERLLAEGAEVLCVDNYFTGHRANVAHLLANPLFEALRHDVTLPLFVDDPERRRPDLSLVKSCLGWTPHIGLEEGLAKTIFYFRQLVSR